MSRRYVRGRNFEYQVKYKLVDQGYFVIRAAASKPIDLVAIRKGDVMLVECKRNKKQVTQRLREELRRLGEALNVSVAVAYRDITGIIIEKVYSPCSR